MRLADIAWHLIGLWESQRQAGLIRVELRGEQMWIVPLGSTVTGNR